MNTRTMFHTSDPVTSTLAASQVDPYESNRLKLALVDLLDEAPRTADELTEAYFNLAFVNGWPQLHDSHNCKRRLSDLHKKHHVIRESGDRRPSRMGKLATVWELSVPAEDARAVVNAS